MTPDWRLATNRASGSARIADIQQYVSTAPTPDNAPVDAYYARTTELLRVADPAFLGTHPFMGPLLLVGLVSATENYFRDLFAGVIEICPVAQDCCAQQQVSLGSVLWHSGVLPQRGAFDHLSLAAADNVKKTCKTFIGHDLKRNGPTDAALEVFDSVCELRHSIVHSGSIVAGKNALRLQIQRTGRPVMVQIAFAELQEAAQICAMLVAAANSELFGVMAERWAVKWRSLPSWDPQVANRRFLEIWALFRSSVDASRSSIPQPMGVIRCRNLVKKHFGIP